MNEKDLKLLESYLGNQSLIEAELQKNQGIKNLTKNYESSNTDKMMKLTIMDFVEVGFNAGTYLTPQLKVLLEDEICKKWNYCKKKNKYNNRLNFAVALYNVLDVSEIQTQVVIVLPLVLCVAYLVESEYLDKICECK